MSYLEKHTLSSGGTFPRFRFMHTIMQGVLTDDEQAAWRSYIDHSPRDLDEMCRGEYPIGPYIIRVMSALFGVKVDFLLLGSAPAVDRVGASIDVWPMQDAK